MVGVFYDSLYLHFHICVMYLYIDLGFLWFSFPHVLFVFPWLCLYHICMWRLFTSYILWRAMIGSITHTFSLYWLSDYPKHISFPNFMSFYVIFFCVLEDWILSEFVGETLLEKQKNLWFPSLVTGTFNLEACWTYSETFPLRNCLFCLPPLLQSYNVLFAPCAATFKGRKAGDWEGRGHVGSLYAAKILCFSLLPPFESREKV